MQTLIVTALVVAVIVIVLQAVNHAVYRATYRYSQDDIDDHRRSAIQGSRLTKGGQVADQLAPLLPDFYERFDPKDARFIGGGPIDFVIFDGMDTGEVRRVVFLEIKTGSNRLNARQRQVRRVVDEGEVFFETLHLPRFGSELTDEDLFEDNRSRP